MKKREIAEELLKNTLHYERQTIEEYVKNFDFICKRKGVHEVYLRLDDCLNYLERIGFDMVGWELEQIPIEYAHHFLNREKKQTFELIVMKVGGKVIPAYLDDDICEQEVSSIEEAIEKFNKIFTEDYGNKNN